MNVFSIHYSNTGRACVCLMSKNGSNETKTKQRPKKTKNNRRHNPIHRRIVTRAVRVLFVCIFSTLFNLSLALSSSLCLVCGFGELQTCVSFTSDFYRTKKPTGWINVQSQHTFRMWFSFFHRFPFFFFISVSTICCCCKSGFINSKYLVSIYCGYDLKSKTKLFNWWCLACRFAHSLSLSLPLTLSQKAFSDTHTCTHSFTKTKAVENDST